MTRSMLVVAFTCAAVFAYALLAIEIAAGQSAAPAPAISRAQLVQMILHEPDSPVAGNPQGDVTIVAFLDYNCPFCRRSTPELDKFLRSDPNVRVVFKDWPILSPASITEAKIALAANYQGKYLQAHDALMAIKVRPATPGAIKAALIGSGIDVARLNKDLDEHNQTISNILRCDMIEADALHLRGTPVFIVGPFLMAEALDEAGFRQLVTEVRARRQADT